MGLIAVFFFCVLGALGTIFVAFVSRLLTDEFKARMPWLVDRLIRRAVRQLPENQRERYTEEWQSHADQTPGDVGKLLVVFGFLRASSKMSQGLADAAPTMSGQNLNSIYLKRLVSALCRNEHLMSALSDSERTSLQREISGLNDSASEASMKFEQAMSTLDHPALKRSDEWFIDRICQVLELSSELGIAPTFASFHAYRSGDPERLRQAENAFAEWQHAYHKGDPEGLRQAENAIAEWTKRFWPQPPQP